MHKMLGDIVVGSIKWLVFAGVILAIVYFFDFSAPNETRLQLARTSSMQFDLSMRACGGIYEYQELIGKFIKDKTDENYKNLVSFSGKLEPILNEASDVFGLPTKRWVSLFKIWNYNFLHTPKNQLTSDPLDYFDILNAFHLKLIKTTTEVQNDYKLSTYSDALRGKKDESFAKRFIDDKKMEQFEKNYLAISDQMFNKAEKDIESEVKSKGAMACLMDYSKLDTPENMAKSILFVENIGLYCPRSVENKIKDSCGDITTMVGGPMFNELRFMCGKIKSRLVSNEKDAESKYGGLSFDDYFAKYIQPKIKEKIEVLKNSKYEGYCNPEDLPVIAYRNPDVDAFSAAYLEYAPKNCNTTLSNDSAWALALREMLKNGDNKAKAILDS